MTSIASSQHALGQFVFVSMLCSCMFSHAQPLNSAALVSDLDQTIQAHPATRRSSVCLKVVDLASGELLFDHRGDQLMTPASNLKLYTAACALAKFGPEHCFETVIRIFGKVKDGELTGTIIIEPGGDSMISSKRLREMVATFVKQHGLRRILGDVRVDNSTRYASPPKGPGWMWDDGPYYFNMPVTPLMVDFNVLTVRVGTAVGEEPAVELIPRSEYPPLRLPGGASRVSVTRQPLVDEIVVYGSREATEVSDHRVTMNDPGAWVASVFQQMLIDLGVEFEQKFASKEIPRPPTETSFTGPQLNDTLNHFLEESENAVGEILLHEIAIADGVRRPLWKDGANSISDWLIGEAGLEEGSFRLVDGSGLSRYNLISADSSIRLLSYMNNHRHAESFMNSLPKYDVDVSQFEWDSPLTKEAGEGCIRAKGGSMSGVSTCSGVVRTLDGRSLAFSYLTNGFIGRSDAQKDLRSAIWRSLIRYRP